MAGCDEWFGVMVCCWVGFSWCWRWLDLVRIGISRIGVSCPGGYLVLVVCFRVCCIAGLGFGCLAAFAGFLWVLYSVACVTWRGCAVGFWMVGVFACWLCGMVCLWVLFICVLRGAIL